MARYTRKWNCAQCDTAVIYDSERDELTCACGTVKDVVKSGKMNVSRDLGNFVFDWASFQKQSTGEVIRALDQAIRRKE